MYKLGEYPIVAKFPQDVKQFSILFYGARGKGNAYVTLYKSDGTKVSEHVIQNVTNGPYGFSSPEENIAGFSLWNHETGGLAISKIRYGQQLLAGYHSVIVSMMKTGTAGNSSAWNEANTSNMSVWNYNHLHHYQNRIEVFDDSNNGYGAIAGGNQGPIYVNGFNTSQVYGLLGWNKTWTFCNARIKLSFLTASDSLVFACKVERVSAYASRLYYSTDEINWNTWGSVSGSYPAVCGKLSFDSSTIYFTHESSNAANAGYQMSTSYSAAFNTVNKIKVWDCYVWSDYSAWNAIAYCAFVKRAPGEPDDTFVSAGMVAPA